MPVPLRPIAPLSARAGWQPGTLLGFAVAAIGIGSLGTATYRTWYIAAALKRQ